MRYLIKLKPLSPFFFGTEKTFGENNENYYAKSMTIPQQTTLLGMLRHEILIQKSIKKNDMQYSEKEAEEIKKYIGDSGFNIKNAISTKSNKEQQDFGMIKNISPVFLIDSNFDCFIKAPFALEIKPYNFFNSARCFTSIEKKIYLLNGYEPKYHKYTNCFQKTFNLNNHCNIDIKSNITNNKIKYICFDEIFEVETRVGIAKDKKESDEKKFFKQDFYNLKNGYLFAFFLETNDDIENNCNLEDDIVYIGGDRSSFKMTVARIENEKLILSIVSDSIRTKSSGINLLSDALVTEDIYKYCDLAWTEIQDFRNITSATNNYKFKKNKTESKYNLLKSGSTLFSNSKDNLDKIEYQLKNFYCQKIGLNIFNKTFSEEQTL